MKSATGATTYRPDIDGLRALSILAVLAYHGFPSALSGGFVGVDVFFVVSGYLITNLILSELQQERFTFASFYARRVRRIFPALIVVLIAVFAAGWAILFANEFAQLGEHIAGAAVFISNFVLLSEVGYFDVSANIKPLLHLWSLAIEEQFYLFWPLTLVLFWRRKWSGLALTLAFLVGSFVLCVGFYSTTTAFYSPLSRFWELAAGAAIAQLQRAEFDASALGRFMASPVSRRMRLWLRHCLGPLGIVLIALATYMTPATEFSGWWALMPVAGSSLVICSGPDGWINRRILSRSPLVFVGLISYPLYLWHWPLISFAWIAFGRNPPETVIWILLATSVVLAWLTYSHVERPIRFGVATNKAVAALVSAVIVIGGVGLLTKQADGIESRSVVQINRQLTEDLQVPTKTRASDGTCRKFFGIDMEGEEVCLASSKQPKLLIVGDSHSMALYSAIFTGLVHEDAVLLATHSHLWSRPECFKSEPFDVWLGGQAACQVVLRNALDLMAKQPSIEAVVFVTTAFNPFFYDGEKVRALQRAVVALRKPVVYLASVPVFLPPESCRPRRLSLFGMDLSADGLVQACEVPLAAVVKAEAPWRTHLDALARDGQDVHLYDPRPSFCDSEFCSQKDDQGVLYWRLGHVNPRGGLRIFRDFLPWLRANVLAAR